ncbi:GEVED domain-containing protein [Granulicatella elegans]|uniref:YSIRK family Gram-positive signal peptide n=1 Tax=Granulicatella elegans ATCC 700633 TaxID=626369 RepID=D0BL68_9LACT|nr:YSIRK family Gram-positive signal peptide [Granulicatella elegans ATCC 700633]
MGKNNQQKPIKQYQKFGIRKFTQGVASVMIASGMFFMAGGVASANEVAVQTETTTQKVAEETAPKKTEEKQESKQEERTVQLDKTQLENYIKEITSNIEAGKYASKTEESVASLKAELSSAQATLTSAKTQEELTKAYQKLVTTVNSKLKNKSVEKKETPATEDTTNGKPTVGKSAANTEPVSESNSIANTGKNDERNGKEINKENAFRADVADTVTEPPLSEEEQANHWKQYADKNTERLTKQIKWFDIANSKATVENIGDGDRLKVGTKFTQEISPGYVVTLTVTKLAPFNSTDEYKKRGGAGYDANAQNVYKDNTPAELKVVTQGGYSVAKTNGMDTQGKTVIQSVVDGANVGVEFSVKSTLNGKEVPSNVVFLTGEEAGSSEIEIYKTDGDGFELVTELSNTTPQYSTARSYIGEIYERRTVDTAGHGQNRTDGQLGISYTLEGNGKPAFAPFLADKGAGFFNTTVTSDTVITATAKDGTIHADGLGTQVFGPVSTHRESGFSTPLVMTRNAKNIGMYILSAGQQGSMLGFMVLDEGDAPASYGRVAHSISKSDGQKQPYLGSVPADVDVRTTPINKTTAFVYDDINGIGAADEGARQLMGDDVAPNDNYKLKKVNDGTYSMTFDAHLDGEAKAYVNGWIDFNNNGKFDEGEAAGVTEVTQDGKVTLTWTNNYQNVDTTATKLATRLRIAYDKADVKAPTGIAYSGEVEDFQIQQTIPPRGTKKETKDVQGATQTSTVAFNAYGQKNYDFDKDNAIDTTVKSQIVKPDGSLVRDADLVDGYYVVPGQGKYKITDNGVNVDVEFIPEANFVGTADGITIRRTDVNGNTTGWGNEGRTIIGGEGENKDQLELVSEQVQLTGLAAKGSMDGRYIPTVTPKEIKGTPEESTDIQGKPQTKTPKFSIDVDKDGDGTAPDAVTPSAQYPAKLVDPATGQPTDEKTVTVKGEGTYTIDPETGAVTFTPEPQFTGTAKGIDVSLTAPVGQDKNGQPATATATTKYTPTVTPVKPTAAPDTSTGVQGETQTGKPTFTEGNTEVPIKEGSVKLLNPDGTEANGPVEALDPTGKKIGEYTVDPTTGVVTFTPTDKSYTGPVQPAKVQAEDKNGSKVDTTYTPSIVGVTPTAEPATTQDIQGKTQESAVSFEGGKTTIAGKEKAVEIDPATYTLLGEDGQPATEVPAKDPEGNVIGKYTLKTVDGKAVAVFEPTDKTYSGDVQPVRVQAKDKNGTAVETTYTPKITPVTPTAEPAQSAAIQGETQKGTPTFSPGDTIAPIKENSYKLLDKEGNEVPAGQTTPAYAEDGVTPVGTYSINPATGEVTFTPTDKSYTGKVLPAEVQGEDTNGTKVSTTYTPSIVPATPTAEPAKTVDVQGATQTGKPVFQGGTAMVNGEEKTVEIDEDKPAKLVDPKTGEQVDSVTVAGEGTYTVAPDGTVTFTPEKTFTGVAKGVEVVRQDKNGTPVKASYTPEVKPATPTGTDAITEDVQGSTQTGKPTFEGGKVTVNGEEKTVEINEDKPAKLVDPKTGDPVDSVTIEGEGTYTVAPDGTVTFKPEKNFTGKGTGVTVQREDKNGTPVKAKYTPVVKPTTPTSTDVITTNVQGATQEGTPTFEGGKVTVNGEEKTVAIDETVKPTFDDGTTEKKVPGEGTYTIDENGKVTFTPEKTFTGQATGVTVKRVDKNGTPVTAKYTPVVVPVTPTSKDSESEGPKGQPQSGTPTFEGGKVTINGKEVPVEIDETVKPTFEDGTTEKKVPGEGTYTIDENGKVTFTPEPDFVGKASGVTVKRVDKNGTPVTAKYTPTVRPNTTHVDKDGNPLSPSEDGTKPTKDIPGYKVVKTEIDEKGNTKHIYEKVTTTHKDKDGNVIPGTTTEEGTTPKKDIPGYRFVETKTLPNGDTEHVYEKVKTSHKDKEGNEIPNYPTEDGEQPKKDIPGYRFVETKKLPNGDIEHVYEKVKTSHKDKEETKFQIIQQKTENNLRKIFQATAS